MKLVFKKFTESDFSLIDKWLKEPHVEEAWGTSDYKEAYEKYVLRTSTDGSVAQFIIYDNDQPIGYIQYYWASKVGDGWWEGYPHDVIGFDFYIGNPELLGKGLGRKIILEFCSYIFKTTHAQEIIGDPSPRNTRIHYLLKYCGFTEVERIITPDGEAILFKLLKSKEP